MTFLGVGFVSAKVNDLHIYRCHVSPNATLAQYEEMVDGLVLTVQDHSPKIIAVNFNARALNWGCQVMNTRHTGLPQYLVVERDDLVGE